MRENSVRSDALNSIARGSIMAARKLLENKEIVHCLFNDARVATTTDMVCSTKILYDEQLRTTEEI